VNRVPHRVASLVVALTAACAIGCAAMSPETVQIETTRARFETARLSYRLDVSRLNGPSPGVGTANQRVSYDESAATPLPAGSTGTLSIEYPHPSGRTGFARVELVVESRQGKRGGSPDGEAPGTWSRWMSTVGDVARDHLPGVAWDEGTQEAWTMDVTRGDLEALIAELGQGGFFTPAVAGDPAAEIEARIDGAEVRKPWHRTTELDALIRRVRTQGQLASHVRPPGERRGALAVASQTPRMNFRDMILRDQQAAANATLPSNGSFTPSYGSKIPAGGMQPGAYSSPPMTSPPMSPTEWQPDSGRITRLPAVDQPPRY